MVIHKNFFVIFFSSFLSVLLWFEQDAATGINAYKRLITTAYDIIILNY